MNGAAEDYIAGAKLWNRTGQEQAATNGDDIEFPRPRSRSRSIGPC